MRCRRAVFPPYSVVPSSFSFQTNMRYFMRNSSWARHRPVEFGRCRNPSFNILAGTKMVRFVSTDESTTRRTDCQTILRTSTWTSCWHCLTLKYYQTDIKFSHHSTVLLGNEWCLYMHCTVTRERSGKGGESTRERRSPYWYYWT